MQELYLQNHMKFSVFLLYLYFSTNNYISLVQVLCIDMNLERL